MGQISIEQTNIENYLLEWQNESLNEADKYYIYKHFRTGKGEDKSKVKFYQLYLDTFNNPNCELSDWIWKEINGFFEEPSVDKDTGQVKSLIYKPVQNVTNIYNEPTDWKKVAW